LALGRTEEGRGPVVSAGARGKMFGLGGSPQHPRGAGAETAPESAGPWLGKALGDWVAHMRAWCHLHALSVYGVSVPGAF
jgi:hypothetical protein